MIEWLRILARIAILRAGPQDLPCGSAWLITALLLYASIVLLAGRATEEAAPGPDLLIALVVPLVCTVLLLFVRGVPARLNQTVSALFGTGALISLVNLPIWFNDTLPMPPPLVLLALAALFWSLAVDAHIWRNALELPFAGGLVTAVVILLVQLYTFQAFLPNPGS